MGTLVKIPNFLTNHELELFTNYTKIRHRNNLKFFDPKSSTKDTRLYADSLTDSLMISKKSSIEKTLGKQLYCSYSELKAHTLGAEYEYHERSPACEYTVIGLIDMVGKPWPLYLRGQKFDLEPSHALLFDGYKEHFYRKEFEGDYYFEYNLHYVDAKGANKFYLKDKKETFGVVGDY